jgi:hypothetical protein
MMPERDTLVINVPAKAAWLAALGTLVTAGTMIFFAGVAWQTLQAVQLTQKGIFLRVDIDHEVLTRHDEVLRQHGFLRGPEREFQALP